MKQHLQQDVAQLFLHILVILSANRCFEFLGFFKEVTHETVVGLLAVPRATLRGPELRHYPHQALKRARSCSAAGVLGGHVAYCNTHSSSSPASTGFPLPTSLRLSSKGLSNLVADLHLEEPPHSTPERHPAGIRLLRSEVAAQFSQGAQGVPCARMLS